MADAADKLKAEYADIYERLAAPFDVTFTDNRGGVDLTYITGEQVATRLNEVLGHMGWWFKVVEHGIHQEADEIWVLGEMMIQTTRATCTRQQFGSQKIKRSRSSGTPLDIGFDLKGAATDSMKKCASLVGVGLYLSHKEPKAAPLPRQGSGPRQQSSPAGGSSFGQAMASEDDLTCEECSEPLTETQFKDGTNWAPSQLAVFGRRKHSRILCMTHYREANQAKRRAEEALQNVPF